MQPFKVQHLKFSFDTIRVCRTTMFVYCNLAPFQSNFAFFCLIHNQFIIIIISEILTLTLLSIAHATIIENMAQLYHQ